MKKYGIRWLASACLIVLLGGGTLSREGVAADAGGVSGTAQIRQKVSTFASPFEANAGQQDRRVAFTARTAGGTLFVTRTGVLVYSLPGLPLAGQDGRAAISERGPGWVLTETLVDAHPVVQGDVPSATGVSRLIGNDPDHWETSVPTFERVALGRAWPGIEVTLAARGTNVEKLYTVAARADARRIALQLDGAERLELAADGALIAHTGNGPVSFTAPRAWQDIKGERKPVRVAYTLEGSRYGFHLHGHDPAYAVVIDPILQSTYLGTSGNDQIAAIVLDASGNVLVAGETSSASFPGTAGGAQPAYAGGNRDAFVARLDNGLTSISQVTYLGGNGSDIAKAIALDASGNVFVTGSTTSTNFPGTPGSAQPTNAGGNGDAFVARLNGALTHIARATYLGGNGADGATAIALDTAGNVYVAGRTESPVFPKTSGGAQFLYHGSADGFVTRLNNNLTPPLLQSTYIGGTQYESVYALAVGPGNDVYVAGWTESSDFPITPGAAQSVSGGLQDGFIARLKYDLTSFTGTTYLGGSSEDYISAIALDSGGDVFAVGLTASQNFPQTSGGAQPGYGGGQADAFVARLNGSLTSISQATYLGGNANDQAFGVALDTSGDVFVAGGTASANFPGVTGGAQPAYAGMADAFVARLKSTLTAPLLQATYLGGSGYDAPTGIAIHAANNNVFVAGQTGSTDFPGAAGGAQPANAGGNDAFVSRITRGLHDIANATANNDGDPHITTTNGIHYNFQAAGEFTALRDLPGLEIQTRQSPASTFGPFLDGYSGLTTCVSLNTAVAARVGKHRVSYQPDFKNAADQGGLQLRVDGALTPLTTAGLNLSGGGRIVRTAGALEIDFPDGTVLIAASYFAAPQWFLNIGVYRTEAAEGIMGAIPQGSWLPALPGGTSVGTIPALNQRHAILNQTFANAWRVNDKTSLFDYAPGTSTATFTLVEWPARDGSCVVPNHPRPAKPLDQARAQEICRPVAGKARSADCAFDVAATGVPDFAKAYLLTQRIEEGATTTTVSGNLASTNTPIRVPAPFLTATVTRLATGGRTPAGTVQFMLDGKTLGKPVRLDSRGSARWTAGSQRPGERRLSARYLPDKGGAFMPSTSMEKVIVVTGRQD